MRRQAGRRFMRTAPRPTDCETRETSRDASATRVGGESHPIMILPQVHLRKPCYDFYFLQAIEFERLLGQRCRRLHARPRPIRGPH